MIFLLLLNFYLSFMARIDVHVKIIKFDSNIISVIVRRASPIFSHIGLSDLLDGVIRVDA